MFNNLIESSSHAHEFKRRGSFLLFTTVTYALVLLITGVVSIYAYDAHLAQQNLDLEVTLLTPETLPSPPERPTITPATGSNSPSHRGDPIDIRRQLTARVDMPQLTPDKVSAAPNPNLPVRNGPVRIGDTDSNFQPDGPGSARAGSRSGTGSAIRIDIPDEPPAVPTSTPPVKILRISTVINNKAISLPKPNYPPLAKNIRLQGMVNVQVLIDERGNVISAKAVSGHPLLIPEAQRAALQAKFSPAFIGEQPVKVSGVISYNFLLSN